MWERERASEGARARARERERARANGAAEGREKERDDRPNLVRSHTHLITTSSPLNLNRSIWGHLQKGDRACICNRKFEHVKSTKRCCLRWANIQMVRTDATVLPLPPCIEWIAKGTPVGSWGGSPRIIQEPLQKRQFNVYKTTFYNDQKPFQRCCRQRRGLLQDDGFICKRSVYDLRCHIIIIVTVIVISPSACIFVRFVRFAESLSSCGSRDDLSWPIQKIIKFHWLQ